MLTQEPSDPNMYSLTGVCVSSPVFLQNIYVANIHHLCYLEKNNEVSICQSFPMFVGEFNN